VPEDFRVEVELDDDAYGYSLWERLRALNLDDAARERLGKSVVVTRDESRVFLYAVDEDRAREAERVVRSLTEAAALTADIRTTRWHPVEETWKDASIRMPRTPNEEEAEYSAREAAETREAELEGDYDWQVVVHLHGRSEAADLADRLAADGLPVARRWRYVVVGAVTEERADELAERLRAELSGDADVSVEVNLSDLPLRPFQFIGF
jgi:hypothetical protein